MNEIIVAIIAALVPAIASVTVSMVNLRSTKDAVDKKQNELIVLTLRTNLQGIYSMYRQEQRMPLVVYKGVCDMYDQYINLQGNSYIHSLKGEMDSWERY